MSNLKKLVRARMEETGKSYQAALRDVRAQVAKDVEESAIEFADIWDRADGATATKDDEP